MASRKKTNKKKNKKGYGFISDVLTKGYQTIANNLFGGNLSGKEIHAPILTSHGIRIANYEGPGTDVLSRLKKNIQPISTSDKFSLAHDLRYSLGKDVRNADTHMVKGLAYKTLNPFSGESFLDRINNTVAATAIGGKILGEKIGLFNTETFTKPVSE